jgi:hypothetical protein
LLSALVVAQVALSLALLSISGLLLRTLRNVRDANPGFEQDHILTASVGLNMSGYTEEQAAMIRHKILDRVFGIAGRRKLQLCGSGVRGRFLSLI